MMHLPKCVFFAIVRLKSKRKTLMQAQTHYSEEFYVFDNYLIVQKWTPIRPWYQRFFMI